MSGHIPTQITLAAGIFASCLVYSHSIQAAGPFGQRHMPANNPLPGPALGEYDYSDEAILKRTRLTEQNGRSVYFTWLCIEGQVYVLSEWGYRNEQTDGQSGMTTAYKNGKPQQCDVIHQPSVNQRRQQ